MDNRFESRFESAASAVASVLRFHSSQPGWWLRPLVKRPASHLLDICLSAAGAIIKRSIESIMGGTMYLN
jgi:hypothetical protein